MTRQLECDVNEDEEAESCACSRPARAPPGELGPYRGSILPELGRRRTVCVALINIKYYDKKKRAYTGLLSYINEVIKSGRESKKRVLFRNTAAFKKGTDVGRHDQCEQSQKNLRFKVCGSGWKFGTTQYTLCSLVTCLVNEDTLITKRDN